MRFENAKQNNFLGRWTYSIALNHQLTKTSTPKVERWRSKQEFLAVEAIETFLGYRATGDWVRQGNVLYVDDLNDAFVLRLYFEPDIKVIRKARGSQE